MQVVYAKVRADSVPACVISRAVIPIDWLLPVALFDNYYFLQLYTGYTEGTWEPSVKDPLPAEIASLLERGTENT